MRTSAPRTSRLATSRFRRRLLFTEKLEDRRLLAAIVVNSMLDDTTDGDNLTTLREAIIAANADPDADRIEFSQSGTISIDSQLPRITGPLTIDGGNQVTIDGSSGNGYRLLEINDGTSSTIDVTLSGLTLTGGDATGNGGAIANRERLVISGSTVIGNRASEGGGGIFSDGTGDLTVLQSTIADNSSTDDGGGIWSRGNGLPAIISQSTISGNSTNRFAGGIALGGSGAVITSSTITNNQANADDSGNQSGGGLAFPTAVPVTLNNTIVAGNFRGTATTADDVQGNLPFDSSSSNNLIGIAPGIVGIADQTNGNLVGVTDVGLGPLADNGGPTQTHALLPGSLAINAAALPAPMGAVGHYRFEEATSTTTAADSSGNGNAGTFFGGVALQQATGDQTPGFAAAFDGIDDYVASPHSINDDFTIAMWVKTSQASASGAFWYQGFGLVDGEVAGGADLGGTSVLNGRFALGISGPDTTLTSTSQINDGRWHHVAATRDGTTGQMTVYVNGIREASVVGPTGARTTPANLNIGRVQSGVNYFAGELDDVMIFDRAIDDAEVESLAFDQRGGPFRRVVDNVADIGATEFFAPISIVQSGGSTIVSESGTSDTLTVALGIQPFSDVVLSITGGDATEAGLDLNMLTFTPQNWNDPQTVTMTGIADGIIDRDQTPKYTVSVDIGVSDSLYTAVDPVSILTTVSDIDFFVGSTSNVGDSAPIDNVQPFATTNYAIALVGTFPSRDGGLSERFQNSEPFLGEIIQFAGDFAPRGYALAQGQLLAINQHQALFSLLGTTFGGDGRTSFGLPDLRGRVPITVGNGVTRGRKFGSETVTMSQANLPTHGHQADGISTATTGNGQPINNQQPTLGLHNIMDINGEVRWVGFGFAPRGYGFPEGQLLPIAGNELLFSNIGTLYGGDGTTNFQLPDLRGRVLIGEGSGPGLTTRNLGDIVGDATTILTTDNLPAHQHGDTSSIGGGQSFSNIQPSIVVNQQIAMTGIFPSRSLVLDDSGLAATDNDGEALTLAEAEAALQELVDEGVRRWRASGVADQQIAILESAEFEFSELEPGVLGKVDQPGVITLDLDAAGLGWYIDATPGMDEEFPSFNPQLGLVASSPPAIGSIDLLTVLMHEQGHLLGFGHDLREGQLLSESLPPGVRRLPSGNEELADEPEANPELVVFLNETFFAAIHTFVSPESVFEDSTLSLFEPTDGQLISIGSNTALFSVIGTTYGGDGRTTFGLPDFRGRVIVGDGNGPGLTPRRIGNTGGSETTTLTTAQIATHSHPLFGGATLVVDTLSDELDGDRSAGDFSLREAIELSNTAPGIDTITFSPELFAQDANSIDLEAALGEMSITDAANVLGPGADLLTIDAQSQSRIFNVNDNDDASDIGVRISGLTLTGGNAFGSGGAVLNFESLSIIDSVITDSNGVFGGGIASFSGSVLVSGSTLSRNLASSSGGALFFVGTAVGTVVNSTVSDNESLLFAGGIGVNAATLNVSGSTITGNLSEASGGGFGFGASDVSLNHSIVSDNFSDAGTTPSDIENGRTLAIGSSFNLIGSASTAGGLVDGVDGNIVGQDPMLMPLADNGGPTPTHALMPNSPAIDAGPRSFVNVARGGITSESSFTFNRDASRAFNGNFLDETHTDGATDTAPFIAVEMLRDESISHIVLHNRGGFRSRLRDITVEIFDAAGAVVFTSPLLNPENVLGGGTRPAGPSTIDVDLVSLTGGTILGRSIRISRTPDPDLLGTGGDGGTNATDEANVLSLAEVEVFAVDQRGAPFNRVVGAASDIGAFELQTIDFGDAPARYAGDASHQALGPQLGANRDGDFRTAASPFADGDDLAGIDDDDGVLFGVIVPDATAGINIDLQNADDALIDAWIDFDGDGQFDDPTEKILSRESVVRGLQTKNYDVPSDTVTGLTFARVRVSTAGGLSPTGTAADGEVEDYAVTIGNRVTTPTAIINPGSNTRSEITKIEVQFNEPVIAIPSDFVLTDSTGLVVSGIAVERAENNTGTLATLTFTGGPGVITGTNPNVLPTLADGIYQLHYRPSLPLNDDGLIDIDNFFRNYGDTDVTSNPTVGLADFAAFRSAFGSSVSEDNFNSGLDADRDGVIGLTDFAAFRSNFGNGPT